MPNKLYLIKPLEWEEVAPIHFQVTTDFAVYSVRKIDNGLWELYNSRDKKRFTDYSSESEAKSKAQEDWNNRISQYLTEYKEEK